MKKNVKNLISTFLFFVIALIVGCDVIQQDEYYHLAVNNRSLLKTNDTLVFTDNKNNLDTFIVMNKVIGQYISPIGGSCKSPFLYKDIDLIYMYKKNDKNHLQYDICNNLNGITKFGSCSSDYTCDKAIMILTIANEDSKKFGSTFISWYGYYLQLNNTKMDTAVIQNIQYNDILSFTVSNIEKADSIKRLYYSIKSGIVKIDLENGNVFELKLK
jgi:hypothetical protein